MKNKALWLVIPLALAASSARAAAPLRVIRPIVQQIEDGPAVLPGASFVAGETVYFSCHVEGYLVSPEQQVKLSYRVDAFDPKGVKIIESVESNLDTKVSPEDKEWRPKA